MTDDLPPRKERPHDRGGKLLPRDSIIPRILQALEAGSSRAAAAAYGGIHRDTLRAWIAADPELRVLVEQAEDVGEAGYLSVIHNEAVGNTKESWKAAAWVLEKTRPERYGQRARVEVTGDITMIIQKAAEAAGLSADDVMSEVDRILKGDTG